MKLVVTGSRSWPTWREWDIHQELYQLLTTTLSKNGRSKLTVIHGDAGNGNVRAGGVDAMTRNWCEASVPQYGGRLIEARMPADWEHCVPDCRPGHRKTRPDDTTYCPTAGHRRNQKMVDMSPDVVYAFSKGGSRGTADCAARAANAGIRVIRFDLT